LTRTTSKGWNNLLISLKFGEKWLLTRNEGELDRVETWLQFKKNRMLYFALYPNWSSPVAGTAVAGPDLCRNIEGARRPVAENGV
jgi:hypothetical protein